MIENSFESVCVEAPKIKKSKMRIAFFSLSICFWIVFFIPLQGEEKCYQTEGLYLQEPISKTMFWLSRYLPFNPKIGIFSELAGDNVKYTHEWPEGTYIKVDPLADNESFVFDLLWIRAEGSELLFLEGMHAPLQQAKVVYTSTHFFHKNAYYQKLKERLELYGYELLLHWNWENREGSAIFVKKWLLEAERNALSCFYSKGTDVSVPPLNWDCILQKALNKGADHKIKGIDFIYMINLDERPEKFERAVTELRFYGIYPYRFSAVNGWKLKIETIQAAGIQFPSILTYPILGSAYLEENGHIYRSQELIEPNGKTYYSLGLSQGAIGILLSHLSILKDAYDSGYETIWVMEDDVEALSDPREISELIAKLDLEVSSWDILFTDLDTKSEEGIRIPCRAIAARPNLSFPPLQYFLNQFYPISTEFSRTGMRYGAYSMILRRSGIEKILKYYEAHRLFLPYDMDFWLNGQMEMYCLNKDLVSHRNHSLSDNGYATYDE